MAQVFPYANIVAGVLVLVIGFGFHWLGQLISVLNWDFATHIGLQETDMPPEYKIYEHALAIADVAIAWVYGIAAIGLIEGTSWGYKLAWIPGVMLIYHSISAWFWHRNQKKFGKQITSDSVRVSWCAVNFVAGALALIVAWTAL